MTITYDSDSANAMRTFLASRVSAIVLDDSSRWTLVMRDHSFDHVIWSPSLINTPCDDKLCCNV